jgi:aminoglycoside/choline kinase family phosphotransferase
LATLHRNPLPETLSLAPHLDYRVPPFDDTAMLIEVGLMLEWYLPDKGITVTDELRTDFVRLWIELFDKLATVRKTWMLRDFHSPNLIWLGQRRDISRVGILDFQDAVLGPPAYDLVSLLQDARIDVPEDIEIPMLAHYARKRRTADPHFNPAAFAEEYAIMSAQRNTRLLGTFARLNRRDNKPQYLKHQPRVWTYLNRALAHPSLAAYREWCIAHVPPPAS